MGGGAWHARGRATDGVLSASLRHSRCRALIRATRSGVDMVGEVREGLLLAGMRRGRGGL